GHAPKSASPWLLDRKIARSTACRTLRWRNAVARTAARARTTAEAFPLAPRVLPLRQTRDGARARPAGNAHQCHEFRAAPSRTVGGKWLASFATPTILPTTGAARARH